MEAKPRARLRRRYVRAIVQCQGSPPSKEELIDAIRTSICESFGLRGLADVSPRVVFYDQERGILVVRCAHSSVDELCTALALTNHVRGTAVSVNPQTVSGLMRRLTKEPLDQPPLG